MNHTCVSAIWTSKLGDKVDTLEGKDTIERHQHGLEDWVSKNCMMFNKEGIIPSSSKGWGLTKCSAPTGKKRPGGLGGPEVEPEVSKHPWSNKS